MGHRASGSALDIHCTLSGPLMMITDLKWSSKGAKSGKISTRYDPITPHRLVARQTLFLNDRNYQPPQFLEIGFGHAC
jgi:hypothetical protein